MTSMATLSPDEPGSSQLPDVTAPRVSAAASTGVRMHGAFGSVEATAPVISNGPESVVRPKNVYAVGSASADTFGGRVSLGGLDDGATTAEATELGGDEAAGELAAGDVEGGGVAVGVARVVGGLLELTAGPIGRDVVLSPASAVAAIAMPATHSAAVDATAMPRRRVRRRMRAPTAITGSPAARGTPARSRRVARSLSSMSSVIADPPS
jgi:hypothetical protein